MAPNFLQDRSVRLVALDQLEIAPKIEGILLSAAHAGDHGALLFQLGLQVSDREQVAVLAEGLVAGKAEGLIEPARSRFFVAPR